MKYWLALLMLISAPAWAGEWKKVAQSADHGYVYYIDDETIKKDGSYRRFWLLGDFKTKGPLKELSEKSRYEVDCKEERSRFLTLLLYSGNMGTGQVVQIVDKPDNWSYIPPETSGSAVMQYVCRK